MLFKMTYSKEELDRQMDYQQHKCEKCLHECYGVECRTNVITMKTAERTPDITAEQKQRYFQLVGA